MFNPTREQVRRFFCEAWRKHRERLPLDGAEGTAADLIKLSMVAVQDALDAQGKATLMIMQVHDELVFQVPEAERDWVKTEVPRLMASVADLRVPLLAEVGEGPNWEAAH